jgi:P-type Cu+ transporter
MSGIVFFMLLGRYFQDKTYGRLNFERDYRSYFPIGVSVIGEDGNEVQKPVSQIRTGDRLRILSEEIIPADGILFLGKANIDYSFVTGESAPAERSIGEIIYAGGKQKGGAIELEVIREVPQSYLTQLWNNEAFRSDKTKRAPSFVHSVSRYFTLVLFAIAVTSGLYWQITDPSKVWDAVTAVLIVACPCALLLSATFTNGSMLSQLQKSGLYLRSGEALENLAGADTIVFDKTGTITVQGKNDAVFYGKQLTEAEEKIISTLAAQSNHPLSKAVLASLTKEKKYSVSYFGEIKGRGSSAYIGSTFVKMGSEEFVTGVRSNTVQENSRVYISFNNIPRGYFSIGSEFRENLQDVLSQLHKNYSLAMISGDNMNNVKQLRDLFGDDAPLHFTYKPEEKLLYIKRLQREGKKVIMIGDGLNDAGALMQSDAGITVSDDINNFSPACDGILSGDSFSGLAQILEFCEKQKKIIYASFVISILYNLAGLSFAVKAELSPVIAAILMPLSSVSIVLLTTLCSAYFAKKLRT